MARRKQKVQTLRVKAPAGFNILIEYVEPPAVAGQSQDDWLAKMGTVKDKEGFWDSGCGCNVSCNSAC
jgi:hypothetical protein